jgi:predicted ABC-type ATPase
MKIRIKEAQQTPQAIFMAGPAGAGKSFVSKSLPLSKFQVINIDDTYEELLKAAGIGTKIKDFSPEELSQAAKLMAQAQKTTKDKYAKALENLNDIIIDGTGAASKPLLKKKAELEALGYETMMVMIYVSPVTSLERNVSRGESGGRSLTPGIVLNTWEKVNNNIKTYQDAFGDNFVLINNDPKDADTSFDPQEIKRRFFDTAKAKGKPKTPEELAKKKAEVEAMNKSIEQLLKQKPKFTPRDQAISKIKSFIK